MKRMNRKTFYVLAIGIFIIISLPVLWGSGTGASDPFEGIDNKQVLPMLKHLSYTHGGMNVPATDGRLLYDLIVKNGYKRGLEVGTSNGYSGLWLALAFKKTGGNVTTLEIHAKRAEEARKNFRKAGLQDVITCKTGDALKVIPTLKGEFDFVFLDAWKADYIQYFKLLRSRIKPGGVITAHNVLSHSWGMRDFLKTIKSDPGLETTIHHSSSSGVSVSFVRKRSR
jgi:predicted O-methyltransferase YrrM